MYNGAPTKEKSMDIKYLKIARRLWNVDYITCYENRANMRKWVRALRIVGDKWLLANSVKEFGKG